MRLTASGWLAALLVACSFGVSAENQAEPDPVADLLLGLEHALQTGELDLFVADTAPTASPGQVAWLSGIVRAGAVTSATVRARSHAATAVLAEVFVAYGNRAFIANWLVEFGPGAAADRLGWRSIVELSRFDNLVRLTLDESRPLAVTDLVVSGPDFTATVPSGIAFMADVSGGTTGMVVQGRTTIRFTPPDRAEQGQLRIYSGEPQLVDHADDLFVRLPPGDFNQRVSWRTLERMPVELKAVEHAREVFESRSGLSYHFDFGDLTGARWSLSPADGGMLVDFRSDRHGWLTYSRSPEFPEDVSLFHRGDRRQISLYTQADRTDEPQGRNVAADIRHSSLDLAFDPARQWLSGRASLSVVVRQPAASLSLRLAEPLTVSSVSSPGFGPLLPLRPAGYDTLIIGLPADVPVGEVVTVDVQYHGRLDPQALGRERLWVDADASQDPFPLSDFSFTPEPRYLYSNGSWWYPQSTSDTHSPASIRLTVPEPYHALATGELLSTTTSPAAEGFWVESPARVRTFEYRARRPVRYLAALISKFNPGGTFRAVVPAVAGNDPSVSGGTASVNVEVLVGRGQSRRLRAVPERVASIVTFFADLIGEAPFPSLTLAALEDTLPGGHSPAYFALVNQPHAATPLSWSRDPVAFSEAPDFFLAHEIAHQWWGQAVGGRTYRDQWISEGFAQYFAWLYVTSVEGEQRSERMMARMRRTSASPADEGPISLGYRLGHLRGDRRIFRSIIYNKSAVVLHMLRRLIGDDAFFDGVRRLYRDHRFGTADLADVTAAFQRGTAQPLDRFFTRWVRESGEPRLRFTWSPVEGGIVIAVEQAGDVYDLPYEVLVQYADGSAERITLHITSASASFPVVTRGSVKRLSFDDPFAIARISVD